MNVNNALKAYDMESVEKDKIVDFDMEGTDTLSTESMDYVEEELAAGYDWSF